jgi:hypothetical protein
LIRHTISQFTTFDYAFDTLRGFDTDTIHGLSEAERIADAFLERRFMPHASHDEHYILHFRPLRQRRLRIFS